MVNEVKLSGVLCKNITRIKGGAFFYLAIYNGKDENGKNRTAFVNCKYFGNPDDIPEPKSKVTIKGWLAMNEFVSKGEKTSNLVVFSKDIKVTSNPEDRGEVTYQSEKNNLFDENMPF